jgi:hypothetical protein
VLSQHDRRRLIDANTTGDDMHALWPHHPVAPGICVPPPLRVRSACSPEELAAGDLVGALLLGWPESPGLLPSLRLRFLQSDTRTVRPISAAG